MDQKLIASEREETSVARDRDEALNQARQARQEADRNFQENSRLQQQRDSLEAQLNDAKESLKNGTKEKSQLEAEAERLRDDSSRYQLASKAATESNQNALSEAKDDLATTNMLKNQAQDELARTMAVLTDDQKRKLGLIKAPVTPAATTEVVASSVAPPAAVEVVTTAAPVPSGTTAALRVAAVSTPSQAAPVQATVAAAASAAPKPMNKAGTPAPKAAPAQLEGEPRRVQDTDDNAEALLASVDEPTAAPVPKTPKAAPPAHPKSALEKLAAYFSSPLH